MIRDQAVLEKDEMVSVAKLATIRKALNVVLRRFGVSRKQRRNSIGGEVMIEDHSFSNDEDE